MISFSLNDNKISKFLDGLDKRRKSIEAQDRALGNAVGAFIFQDVIDHFSQESGPEKEWSAWSRSYAEHIALVGKSGNKILQDSGRLRNAFKPTSWRQSSDGYEWFNNAKTKGGYAYAAGHNYGDGKLPERKFMWLSKGALEKIGSLTLQFALHGKL